MFECTKCKETKPLTEYHKRGQLPRGHDSWCKTCKSVYRKKYFLENKEKEISRSRVKAWRGVGIHITMEQYKEECALRANHCDICGHKTKTLNVDHCHMTGIIRGYLCGSCNRGLGLLKESTQVLYNATVYLKQYDNTSNNS